MNRYRVSFSASRDSVCIYDRELRAYCGLPATVWDKPEVLQWRFAGGLHSVAAEVAHDAAEDWLENCYRTWGLVPRVGEPHPADVGWEALYALRVAKVADAHFRPNGPSTLPKRTP